MRFPLPTQLKTRPGDLDKDARVKNGYVEIKGEVGVVRKRPGAADLGSAGSGVAQLLACWNGTLGIIGDSLASLIISPKQTIMSPIAVNLVPAFATGYNSGVDSAIFINDVAYVSTFNTDTGFAVFVRVVRNPNDTVTLTDASPSTTVDGRVLSMAASPTSLVGVVVGGSFAGAIWQSSPTPPFAFTRRSTLAAHTPSTVRYANNTFVAMFDDGTTTEVRYSIDDGVTWTSRSIATAVFTDVCWTGTKWVFLAAVAGAVTVYFSTDLVTFTAQTVSGLGTASPGFTLVYTGTQYVMLDAGGYDVYSSPDALSWTPDVITSLMALAMNTSNQIFAIETSGGSLYQRINDSNYQLITTTDPFHGFGLVVNDIPYGPGFCAIGLRNSDGFSAMFYIGTLWDQEEIDEVTPVPITNLSPVEPNLEMVATSTGAAQSQQQMFIKSRDQAWIYTRD